MPRFANMERGSRPRRGGQRRGQLARGAGGQRGWRRPARRNEEEGETEEEKREAVRQWLRDLSPVEQAAELTRLRGALEAERRQLLWKEERISILEEAMLAYLDRRRPSEPAGDPAPAAAAAQPPSASGEERGVKGDDEEAPEQLLIDLNR